MTRSPPAGAPPAAANSSIADWDQADSAGTWLNQTPAHSPLLGWLWSGVRSTDATTVTRKTMQCNMGVMLAIATVLFHMAIFLWLGSPALGRTALALTVPLALLPVVWWLNRRRQLHAARVAVFGVITAAILVVCLSSVGTALNTHAFLIVLAVAAPILLDTRRRLWMVGLMAMSLLLYVVLEWHLAPIETAPVGLPPAWAELLRRSVGVTGTLAVLLLIALNEVAASENETRLRELATTDALTGLPNRRHFHRMFELEAQRGQRDAAPMAVILMDLDHFKQVNDRFGHAGGDQALRHVANVMRGLLRPYDVLARLGGEEFGLLLPRTTLEGARLIAERMREAVERTPFTAQGQIGSVTVSAGVAMQAAEGAAMHSVLNRADQALYAAKHAGRNRVRVAT